ncbi:MAG: PhnD/SsuA/transferrin family substrate-binding protein [Chloroflexota bacterium]
MGIRQTIALAILIIQGLLVMSACQVDAATDAVANVVTVEVTRLVEAPAAPSTPETAVAPTTTPAPTPIPEVITATVEVTRPPLGTAERPIQLLFPPFTSAAIITQRTDALVETLEEATGVEFAVGIADDEQTVVELLCAAPGDTVAFISPAAYAIAHETCNAQAGLVAVDSNGLTTEMGMLVTPRAGGAADLAGLEGLRWAVADDRSLPTYLYFQALLADAGVEPGETVSRAEESSALLTLLDDTADFTTATFVPPLMPFERTWAYGDDPEEWRVLGISPTRSPIGYVIVAGEPENGGYRLRDARSRLFDTYPEIYDSTRIVALSEPIPNDTVALGADFPLALARQILEALPAFAASESCQESLCSADMFGWTGLQPIEDSAYDPIRFIIEKLEIEPTDLWELIG